MSQQDKINAILGLFNLCLVAAVYWLSRQKAPHETRQLDADAVEKYASAASRFADELAKVQKSNEALTKRVGEMDTEIKQRDATILMLTDKLRARDETIMLLNRRLEERDRNMRDLQGWAEELVAYGKKFGGNPPPFKPGSVAMETN